MIDLAMNVARESGVSYFKIIEHPAIHVLGLCTYINAKAEKIERQNKQMYGKSK